MSKYLTILVILFSISPLRAGDLRIDGLFEGKFIFFDNNHEDTKFKVGLQILETNGGSDYRIEGGLIIDGEGGPYVFTETSYDVIDNQLDLKYFRPNSSGSADFRLIGSFDSDNNLAGDVFTKKQGRIGTFKLQRLGDHTPLKRVIKYSGEWSGWATSRSGLDVPLKIVVVDSILDSKNPEGFDFDTTPGKVASLTWGGSQFSIPKVSIDYLRKFVIMSSAPESGGQFNIEFRIIKETQEIEGYINSGLQGRAATFKLSKER